MNDMNKQAQEEMRMIDTKLKVIRDKLLLGEDVKESDYGVYGDLTMERDALVKKCIDLLFK